MATHSGVLAWEMPWTEEAGRLQSMGSQRVRLKRLSSSWFPDTDLTSKTTSLLSLLKLLFHLRKDVLLNSLPWWLSSKESTCQCWRCKLYPWVGNIGEGNGNPLRYSCLGNPMDRGAWWATVHGVEKARHDLVTK